MFATRACNSTRFRCSLPSMSRKVKSDRAYLAALESSLLRHNLTCISQIHARADATDDSPNFESILELPVGWAWWRTRTSNTWECLDRLLCLSTVLPPVSRDSSLIGFASRKASYTHFTLISHVISEPLTTPSCMPQLFFS